MTDRIRLRALSVTLRFHDGGKPDVSFVQEFAQDVPEEVKQDMETIAARTNEANKARNLDTTMKVQVQGRLLEMRWTGAERDLVMLFAIQELLQQTKDPNAVLRALMPRGPARIEIEKP